MVTRIIDFIVGRWFWPALIVGLSVYTFWLLVVHD